MRGFTGLIFISVVFFCGCYTSGQSENSRRRAPKPCRCSAQSDKDFSKWDKGIPERSGGQIAIGIDSEPGLLLSMFSAHPAVAQIIDHDVLEALVSLDSTSGAPVPELALFWKSNPTHTVYTFHMVTNAAWHDGKPFTANDVEYTFKQLLDPAGGAVARSRFEDVANVTATEKFTVVFELDNPRPNFVVDISRIVILPEHIFKNTTVVSNEGARAPIGTGPFRFLSWKPGQSIEIERNPKWRHAPMALNKIIYKIVPERRIAVELFNGGSLDIVTNVGTATAKDAHFIDYAQQQLDAWVFNTKSPFFTDAATRRAVSKLIDRDAIACSIMGCLAKPVFSPWPVPKGMEKKNINRFNAKKARELLAGAGWKDTDGDGILDRKGVPFCVELLLPDTDVTQKRAVTVIVHDLRKAGIGVTQTVVSWAVYTDRLRKHRFDAAVMSVSTAPPFDPSQLFHTEGIRTGRNFGRFSDKKMDSLFDSLKIEQDLQKQAQLRGSITAGLARLQPMAFTFHPFERVLVRKSIHGVRIGPNGIEERYLWLSPSKQETK